jgi:hypothetical protein
LVWTSKTFYESEMALHFGADAGVSAKFA